MLFLLLQPQQETPSRDQTTTAQHRIRSGVRPCCGHQRYRSQRTHHRRRGEMRCELESCRPWIGQFRYPTLTWAWETALKSPITVCSMHEPRFSRPGVVSFFASHDSAGTSTTRSTTLQTVIPATFKLSPDLITDLLRRYSPISHQAGKTLCRHLSAGASHRPDHQGTTREI